MKAVSKWDKIRKRLFHTIEVGSDFAYYIAVFHTGLYLPFMDSKVSV